MNLNLEVVLHYMITTVRSRPFADDLCMMRLQAWMS